MGTAAHYALHVTSLPISCSVSNGFHYIVFVFLMAITTRLIILLGNMMQVGIGCLLFPCLCFVRIHISFSDPPLTFTIELSVYL